MEEINTALLAAIASASAAAGSLRNGRGAPGRTTAGQHSISA
jgi:hypothetical protein